MIKMFLIVLLALTAPASAQTCYTEADVIAQQTSKGAIAVPLNIAETASLIEGFRKAFPDGTWDRSVAKNSIAFIAEARGAVRIVYFKDGCATRMTDADLEVFKAIITETAPKPGEPA